MSDAFDDFDRVRRSGERAALATLVTTVGTAPRLEGARMWVGADGAILGAVTIGGCVDAEVVRAADDVIRTASPRLLALDLADEEAHALGLSCAGTLRVLVQPVDPDPGHGAGEAWTRARERVQAGGRAVIITPLPTAGGGPAAGSTMVVFDEGAPWGSLGHSALDAEAVARAAERLGAGASRTVTLTAGTRPVDVFFDVHGRGPLLVIVGAGAIARPLTAMARHLGMHAVVVDARERFGERDRFPDAAEVRVGMPSEIVAGFEYDANSALVLVAHDHKFDLPALREALRSGAGYVGMLGSRRRAGTILQMLAEEGASPDALARVRTPVGLDIGGQSAAEIALSILAEIIAVRNRRSGGSMRSRSGGGVTDTTGSTPA